MARGVNKVILIGNLGNDPEVRFLPDGAQVANMSIATSEKWTDKDTGELHEQTEWHRVVMFRRLAEIAGEYLAKGSKVYVEGKLQTRKWQDQAGQDRYTTEIVGRELEMLDSRQNGNGELKQPTTPTIRRPPTKKPGVKKQKSEAPPAQDDFDDDIPF